jgi:hypothetical protein
METNIAFAIITLATMLYSVWIIAGQRKTIDKLTDKLMAKDYGEYKRNNHITISDEKPQRKPLSYYDDPSIEVDQ